MNCDQLGYREKYDDIPLYGIPLYRMKIKYIIISGGKAVGFSK